MSRARYESENWRLRLLRRTTRLLYAQQGTGLPRLAEWIRRRMASYLLSQAQDRRDVWIHDFCGNLKFCCDLTEHMSSQIFFRGDYSGDQLIVLRRLLHEDSVFVDAGANQGEFSICAAGVAPEGQVFAFEPVPAIRERLQRNVAANGFRNVQVHALGLSDGKRDGVPIYGAATTFQDGTHHIGLPTLFEVSGRSRELCKISLQCLDDVMPGSQRVDVIKIDVEGAELAVLHGAEKTIRREQPAILFEASEKTAEAAGDSVQAIFEWLRRRGYKLQVIGSGGHLKSLDERKPFDNVLAQPNDHGAGTILDNERDYYHHDPIAFNT